MDLVAADHCLKGAAVLQSGVYEFRHKKAIDQFEAVGGRFVRVQGIVVDDKVIAFADEGVGLVPAVHGTAFQNVSQFQVVMGMGAPFYSRTDEGIEFVFI